jgi:hypothetical protein
MLNGQMPSAAYQNLDHRMRDIEQLMQAHAMLTQFRRAKRAAELAGGNLAQISTVIDNLVTPPGRGRRAEVGAVNRAAIVLLSAHLQGYIEDLYEESAQTLLGTVVDDVQVLVKQASEGFWNPHAYRIERLFSSLGMPRILNDVRWRKATNQSVRRRLTEYVEVRNRIAHGSQEAVSKAKVLEFREFVKIFAKKFDRKVGSEIQAQTNAPPW